MDIGLDFVRDWQWCLGVWILLGLLGVFWNNFWLRLIHSQVDTKEGDVFTFLEGPIYWVAFMADVTAAICRFVFRR